MLDAIKIILHLSDNTDKELNYYSGNNEFYEEKTFERKHTVLIWAMKTQPTIFRFCGFDIISDPSSIITIPRLTNSISSIINIHIIFWVV